LIVTEARGAGFVAFVAVGALVGGSAAALAFDIRAIKSSAVFLMKNIRILFFT
jgi:enoyl-CoA hydratase/carnithine racemase